MNADTGPVTSGGYDLAWWRRLLVAVLTVGVLVQALLAGRGWFDDPDLFDWHARLGDITVLLTLALLVLSVLLYRRRSIEGIDLAGSAALLVLVFVQLMLGYEGAEGNKNFDALSWHVPNGVLIAVVITLLLGRSWPRRA